MLRNALKSAVLGLMALPPVTLALGLGDIRLNSALNAPLDAEIELIGATPEELASLRAGLASRDTFSRYGLDWPAFLGSVRLATEKVDGRDVLKVRSSEVITEPFVTLLVEVNWARGRLVREYTVLLDPPIYTPNPQAAAAPPVAAPSVGESARAGEIERAPAPVAAATPEPAASPASASASEAGGGADSESTYAVQRGDTLSAIAARIGGNRNQTMVGIYRANPDAFLGDMNELRAGAILRIPSREEFAAVGAGEAAVEVRRQLDAWRERTADAGRLRLVTPTEPAGAGGEAGEGASGGDAAAGLRGRVSQLETELTESRRLLELRNAELADLQAKLRAAQASPPSAAGASGATQAPVTAEGEAPPATASAASTDAATADPALPAGEVVAQPGEAAVTEGTPGTAAPGEAPLTAEGTATPPGEPAPTAEEAAAQPQPATAATQEPTAPSDEGGILALLKSFWWLPVLLLAALAGLFGYRKFRERQKMEFDDRLGALAAETSETAIRDIGVDTARMRGPQMPREDSFLVEESGTHERPSFADPGKAPVRATKTVTADETISSETAINLDQGDPLAEADFHMAYGLYDQAADLVRIAISREPGRRDLKLKLLEVFFVWGNREQFLQTARELASTRAEASPGEWEKVVIMGKQLAPDDPLFSQGGVSGAAAAGVDLNLEGGQNRVDFDLFGEGTNDAPLGGGGGGGGVDLQFGAEAPIDLGDRDPTNEAQEMQPSGVDFLLEESAPDHSGNTTRQMTATLPQQPAPRFAGLDVEASDAPTVEQPALRSNEANATIRQKVEVARRPRVGSDQTAEVALDDLGLDLEALDKTMQTSVAGPDGPTMVAGLDERSRRMMEEAERRAAPNGAAAPGPSESGTWFVTETDLEAPSDLQKADAGLTAQLHALGTNGAAPHDGSETSRLAALKPNDIDLDLGRMDHERAHSGANGVDLDVGAPTLIGDGPFTSTQKVAQEELALPDLEPVTMSEVGTKLDLARAYMDMGDPEGARNILEEVLQEGSVSQKQEAQRLIDSLPG